MRFKPKRGPISEATRTALDDAITNIVQAIGSKAGVLTFWDEKKDEPGHYSTYGLNANVFEELRPTLHDILVRLKDRSDTDPEELAAISTEVPLMQGNMHVLALPIQADGRFIAGLCLLQPLSAGLPNPVNLAAPALPPGEPLELPPPGFDTSEPLPASIGGYGLAVDQNDLVTRNARLIKRLVEENQRLQTIISYSADSIVIVDADCNIVGFNPAFARLSGYTVEELRGQNCVEALQLATDRGNAKCDTFCPLRLGIFADKPDEERRAELVLTTKDGEKRDIELTYSIILSPHRDVLGGILGARDITARKEAEELQSTFLSVISHELQTPIAIIKGYAGLYADKTTPLDPDQVRDKMNIIQEESDRLSKLVENLLYASRIQAGGIELNRSPLDLSRLITRVAQKMKSVSKHHTISTDLPDELPTVLADYEKIEEVLINLIENAIKYSPRGGPIVVGALGGGNEVTVSVTDRGIGVPAAEREHVFDRFSRLDSRYVRERKGAGLGLYICKAIVEAHGGRIWVEAAPPTPDDDKPTGSRFNFSLPRENPVQLPVVFGR